MTAKTIDLMADPTFKEFINAYTELARTSQDISLDEARKISTEFFLPPDTVYEPIARIEDIEIMGKSKNKIPLRIFIPSESKNLPVIVYLHRGGWVFGNIKGSDPVCRKLANHWGAVVIAVEYRLAPENPFPSPLEDCYAATEWAEKNAGTYGGDTHKLVLCGESAGGNLAAAVSLMARDSNGPKIAAQVLICPVISSTINEEAYETCADRYFLTKDSMTFFWSMYLQSPNDRMNLYASPDQATDFNDLPPAVIITAECDALHQEAEAYATQLRDAHVKVIAKCFPGVIHGFIDLPIYPESKKIAWIEEIGKLLKSILI